MVTNGKECKNPSFSSVAATVEKASTYVFAERLIRNAEVRGSTPLCSTNNSPYYNNLPATRFQERESFEEIISQLPNRPFSFVELNFVE